MHGVSSTGGRAANGPTKLRVELVDGATVWYWVEEVVIFPERD
jgi:hypothetical protein